MPRKSLDKWVYKLKTIDICVTRHTLDDIYEHMKSIHKRMTDIHDKYKTVFEGVLNELEYSETNAYHYTKYNWRKGHPSRFWLENVDRWYIADAPEDEQERISNEVFLMFQIFADFMVCDNYITEWDDNTEWKDLVYDVSKMNGLLKNSFTMIRMYESHVFQKCKDEWFIKDQEWIKESERKAQHKKHLTIDLPSVMDREIEPSPYPSAPLRDDCVYCTQHWEETKPKYEKAVDFWKSNKKDHDDWMEEQAKQREEQRRNKELKAEQLKALATKNARKQKDLCCKDCDYEAEDEDEYEEHTETVEHKKNMLFCKACNTQCGNEKAFLIHNETTKHKKNVGLIDKIRVFKCTKCEYQTYTRCNFEKHIINKKHTE
jgi:hypothetical protein